MHRFLVKGSCDDDDVGLGGGGGGGGGGGDGGGVGGGGGLGIGDGEGTGLINGGGGGGGGCMSSRGDSGLKKLIKYRGDFLFVWCVLVVMVVVVVERCTYIAYYIHSSVQNFNAHLYKCHSCDPHQTKKYISRVHEGGVTVFFLKYFFT